MQLLSDRNARYDGSLLKVQTLSLTRSESRIMMEEWISRWETTFGVAPRLSQFCARPEARALRRALESEAEIPGDVEVFAFLLVVCVWPEEEWEKQPSDSAVQDAIRHLEQARRSLGSVSNTGWLGIFDRVHEIRDLLGQWARILRVRRQYGSSITVGTQTIWGKPAARGRQRAKRTVVFFLTYYFKTLGYRRTPWDQIARFLFLCGLAPNESMGKAVGTWWSTVLKRHGRQHGDAEPLEPAQQGLLQLFQHYKAVVWSSAVPP